MKQSTNLFYMLLLGLIFTSTCNDEEPIPAIPAATQDGRNTFGCFIDGELLVPKEARGSLGTGGGAKGLQITYRKDSFDTIRPGYFSITASNFNDAGGDLIYIYIPSLYNSKSYTIGVSNGHSGIDSPPNSHVFANVYDRNDNYQRYLSYYESGEIVITRFDTINTIISGTFELKMIDQETKADTIEITDGRFDINWSTLYKE